MTIAELGRQRKRFAHEFVDRRVQLGALGIQDRMIVALLKSTAAASVPTHTAASQRSPRPPVRAPEPVADTIAANGGGADYAGT